MLNVLNWWSFFSGNKTNSFCDGKWHMFVKYRAFSRNIANVLFRPAVLYLNSPDLFTGLPNMPNNTVVLMATLTHWCLNFSKIILMKTNVPLYAAQGIMGLKMAPPAITFLNCSLSEHRIIIAAVTVPSGHPDFIKAGSVSVRINGGCLRASGCSQKFTLGRWQAWSDFQLAQLVSLLRSETVCC